MRSYFPGLGFLKSTRTYGRQTPYTQYVSSRRVDFVVRVECTDILVCIYHAIQLRPPNDCGMTERQYKSPFSLLSITIVTPTLLNPPPNLRLSEMGNIETLNLRFVLDRSRKRSRSFFRNYFRNFRRVKWENMFHTGCERCQPCDRRQS